ncbi:uncharacterized protein LOC111614140 [Centruroides sculpturatus]|uniref:uncharacterized protein LOC111614140 n=1 Tax=Centruroides sculpturatus TaxID=218467 RepID=UPI000C6E54E9|nr:uncharacterized protein LOC111614140 [Centruroides sculpturatus]
MDSIVVIECTDGHQVTQLSYLESICPMLHDRVAFNPEHQALSLSVNATCQQMSQVINFIEQMDPELENLDNAFEIYLISNQFNLSGLRMKCQHFMVELLNVKNICRIYEFAVSVDDHVIQFYCLGKFEEVWEDLIELDEFLDCKESTIMKLISRPCYKNIDEFLLIIGVYNWAKRRITDSEESNREVFLAQLRSVIDPFIPKFRFLVLEIEDLTDKTFNNILDCLTPEEKDSLLTFYTTGVLSNCPETLCQERNPRRLAFCENLYSFQHRHFFQNRRNFIITNETTFTCEIFVKEDTYVLDVELPIYHSKTGGIDLLFCGYLESRNCPIQNQILNCNSVGHACVDTIFLKRDSTARFTVKISDPSVIEGDVMAKNEIDYFYENSNFGEVPNEETIDNFYFTVGVSF